LALTTRGGDRPSALGALFHPPKIHQAEDAVRTRSAAIPPVKL
jgi:hypothetical protein